MKRLLVVLVGISVPAVAAADVAPEPQGYFTTNTWAVIGSIALGIILAMGVWKLRSAAEDKERTHNE
jgi:hypothetical protein